MIEHIYGIDYEIPDIPRPSSVYNRNLDWRQQKFERTPIPSSFDDIDVSEDGEPMYTQEQLTFIHQEFERITKGFWFYNKGKLTFITGPHYFYLNYYTLESGDKADYRETDRKWFYFFDYCYARPYIKGIIRIKKRREGASSQVCSTELWMAITTPNSNCGIISKTGKDAQKAFSDMVVKAFNNLPLFLRPRAEDPESKTQLVFAKPKEKSKKKQPGKAKIYNSDRGMDSRIDHQTTVLNSYDSVRMSLLLIDEAGKFPKECPVNQYWEIVKKTLMQGAKRVGFAFLVSTVNTADTGGTEYKALWSESDHFSNKITASGLYRYFSPAYEGLGGFIDEWGFSIVEGANEKMKKRFLEEFGGEYDGAKDYLMSERKSKKDPVALNEETRMMPWDEREAFLIDQSKCYFNVDTIQAQIDYLDENPVHMRRGKFYMKDDGSVSWMDVAGGPWRIYKFPPNGIENRWHMTDKGKAPSNTHLYRNGIDPHRHSHTKTQKELSKTSAWIAECHDLDDPTLGGPVAWYYDRPSLKSQMYEQVMYACIYYGCKVHYETDAGDDYYDFYRAMGLLAYIRKTPTCAMDPNKKGEKVMGTSSRDPYALSKQLEQGIQYFDLFSHKIFFRELLEEALIYDHSDRQVYDKVVSFLICLLDLLGDTQARNERKVKVDVPLVKTYNLLKRQLN